MTYLIDSLFSSTFACLHIWLGLEKQHIIPPDLPCLPRAAQVLFSCKLWLAMWQVATAEVLSVAYNENTALQNIKHVSK